MDEITNGAVDQIHCMTCGKPCHSVLKHRIVCEPCYRREPKAYCSGCKQTRRDVSPTTGICAHCAAKSSTCSACGRPCQSAQRSRIICQPCYKRLPRARCSRCQQHAATGHCPKCVVVTARPVAACSRCKHERPIYNQDDGLCRRCHDYIQSEASRKALQVKRPCSVCGKLRSAAIQN